MGPIEQAVQDAMDRPLGEFAEFLDATASLRDDPGIIPWEQVALSALAGLKGVREGVAMLCRFVDGLGG